MFAVRVHGRGGQGVVTAAELLSLAAFTQGLEAQAFPSFGSERMGAPVVAFCRVDTEPIRLREPIAQPDAVVVQDPTLLHHVEVFAGLREEGYVLVNSTRSIEQLGLSELSERARPERLATVPASEIARARLGRPIPNAALLGALAAQTGIVSLAALTRAIEDRFGGAAAGLRDGAAAVARGNAAAAADGFRHVAELTDAGAQPAMRRDAGEAPAHA
jgi:pyruvate ferredoxin oxidoreductase gamma subunit